MTKRCLLKLSFNIRTTISQPMGYKHTCDIIEFVNSTNYGKIGYYFDLTVLFIYKLLKH